MVNSSLSPGQTILKSKIMVIFGEECKDSMGFFHQSFVTWKLYHVLNLREAPAADQFWGIICEVCDVSLGALQPACT